MTFHFSRYFDLWTKRWLKWKWWKQCKRLSILIRDKTHRADKINQQPSTIRIYFNKPETQNASSGIPGQGKYSKCAEWLRIIHSLGHKKLGKSFFNAFFSTYWPNKECWMRRDVKLLNALGKPKLNSSASYRAFIHLF